MTDESLFDQYADDYDRVVAGALGLAEEEHEVYLAAKVDELVRIIERHVGDRSSARVLDVGCGTGHAGRLIGGRVGRYVGIDVSDRSLQTARAAAPNLTFDHYDGQRLPYPDAAFDVSFATCVLHHVPPPQWVAFLSEMRRVTRPGGLVAVFEHNPWNPVTRRVVNRCPFDEDAVLLSRPEAVRQMAAAGLTASILRWLLFIPLGGRLARRIDRALAWMPIGAQYVVAATVEEASAR